MGEPKRKHSSPKRFRGGYTGAPVPEGARLLPPQEPPAWVPRAGDAHADGESKASSADQQVVPPGE